MSRKHQVEIGVGLEAEDLKGLMDDFAVLPGEADMDVEFVREFAKVHRERCELNGLRASAEDDQKSFHG